MPAIRCPYPGCDYSTEHNEPSIAAALLNAHSILHAQAQAAPPPVPAANSVRVRCPIEHCAYVTDDVDPLIASTLLNVHARAHQNTPQPLTAKVEKVRRPTISSGGTSEAWSYFNTRWKEYTQATGVTGTDLVIQLLECCDDNLRKDLTRSAGGTLTGKTEAEVISAIKLLAVREENAMVARVALHDMRQDRDEPVRSFCARVKGQASVCKYTTKCPGCTTEVDYTDAIVRDVVSRGLGDSDIQLELLGHTDQDMSLEKVIGFVESKEAGKRSAFKLSNSSGAQAANSSGAQAAQSTYKQSKRQDKRPPKSPDTPCGYCGKPGHAGEPEKNRRNVCPAYNHRCSHCGRHHHFDNMCRSRMPKPARNNEL